MRRRKVGTGALEIGEIGFGTAGIGGLYRACERETAMATLDTAWNAGVRYYDTAPFYGLGQAERRLGDFLRDRPSADYVLSTKVGRLLDPLCDGEPEGHGYVDVLPFAMRYDYSGDGIRRSIEASHHRLGLGRIDIVFVHDIGTLTHGPQEGARHMRDLLETGLPALEDLKAEGVIKAYGLGVNEVDVCLDVVRRAPLDVILLAGRHTLLDRSAEAELLPLCRERGTSLVVGGVYNSGILVTGARQGANFDYGPASSDVLERVTGMERLAASRGYPLAAAAISFPLREERVCSLLLGGSEPAHVVRNMELLDRTIPDEDFALFDPYAIR